MNPDFHIIMKRILQLLAAITLAGAQLATAAEKPNFIVINIDRGIGNI